MTIVLTPTAHYTGLNEVFTAMSAYVAITHYRYQEQVWVNGYRAELDALIAAGRVKLVDELKAWDGYNDNGLPAYRPSMPIYLRRIVAVDPPTPEPVAPDSKVLLTELLKLLRAADRQLPTKTALSGTIWLKSVRMRNKRGWEKEVDPLFRVVILEAHAAGFITAAVHLYTDKWIAYASIPMTVRAQVNQSWRASVHIDALLPLVKLLDKSAPLDLSYHVADQRLVMRQGRNTTRLTVLENDVFYDHALPEKAAPETVHPEPEKETAMPLYLPAPACSICAAPAPRESYADKPVCDNCYGAILSYSLKVKSRADRLYARAEKMSADSHADWQRARTMQDAIPFGQPILVGHHSEKRDRNYRDRIWNTMRRAYDKSEAATDLERRARASEKNRTISSDDPAAVLKLQEKLDKQEAWQETMKAVNALIRKHIKKSPEERARLLCEAFPQYDEFRAARLVQGDLLGRYGYPDYALKNNSAEIRRLRRRIDELQAQRTTVAESARESQYGDITLVRDAEENRLRLIFPGKPARAVIDCLKSNGFRWSPYNKAWQRQLNASTEYAAQRVIEFVQKQG